MTGPDLKSTRERLGFTSIAEAARQFDVSRDAWSFYERGIRPVPLVLSYALAAYAYGLPPIGIREDLSHP